MLRRTAASLLLAVLAATMLGVTPSQVPLTLAATSGVPGIVAQQTCVPVDDTPDTTETQDVVIDGHGFEPGDSVSMYVGESFDGGQQPVAEARVDGVGHFRVTVPVTLPLEPTAIAVAASSPNDGPSATLDLAAPCPPTLVVTPTCAGPDAPFDLDFAADGFLPDTQIYVGIVLPDDAQQPPIVSDALTTDGRGRLRYRMQDIAALPAGVYQAAAVQGGSDMARIAATRDPYIAATPIELPCPEAPRISLTPDCGPAGRPEDRYDVTIQGVGFLYGPATVTWDVGGSEEEFPIRLVGDDGVLQVRIDPWRHPRGRVVVRVTQRFPVGEDRPNGFGAYANELRPPRVAEAVFRVPCRPTATPSFSLDPDCDAPAIPGATDRRMRIRVRATALPPGALTVVFDADAAAGDVLDPERFDVEADENGQLATTIRPIARPAGEYRVTIEADGSPLLDATVRVPCTDATPALRPLIPTCGPLAPGVPDAFELRVRGRGFYPGLVEVLVGPRGQQDAQTTTADAEGTFDTTVSVTGRDRGEVQVLGRQRDTRGTVVARATRTLVIPCVEPTIRIDPESGPAGYAAVVTGADFPPGSVVTLTWDRGLTVKQPTEVTADAQGAFRIGVYVLPRDLDGRRVLTAGTPTDPAAYPGVTADYLVQPGTGQPPLVPMR